MRGFWLVLPFLLIRFVVLSRLNQTALHQAARFAPLMDKERYAYVIYQISNVAVFGYLCFLEVPMDGSWMFGLGSCCYLLGLLLCFVAVVDFAKQTDNGLRKEGCYRFSRHPMYVAYFVYFMACVFLTRSWLLFGFVMLFQISSHWIVLSEERWCIQMFGEAYQQYQKEVRRYL